MVYKHILAFMLLTVLFSFAADANMRRYSGTIDNSIWNVTEENKLQCELTHQIPNYGHAVFSSEAGKVVNLAFELDMLRMPNHYGLAQIEAVPPAWKPGRGSREISQLQWRDQFNGEVEQKAAWQMLKELENGNFPTLYYRDWDNQTDRVAVALSATNFADSYYQFLACMDGLLPYTFDDISQFVVNFEFGGAELDKESQQKIALVEEYLKHDKQVASISVKAYSDSWGGRWHNLQVSKKRADEIKQLFVKYGIEENKITVEGFGERRHVASNDNELGRQENRRVVIEMKKR